MRTIKFRGKILGNNKWAYGSLIIPFRNPQKRVIEDDFSWYVEPDTVGQFTGLYDIDGKGIYEGDILVGANGLNHLITYYEPEASFKAICGNLYLTISNIFIKGCMLRIIGNIHDNPKLITITKTKQSMEESTCIWADLDGGCVPRECRCPYLDSLMEQSDCEDYKDARRTFGTFF